MEALKKIGGANMVGIAVVVAVYFIIASAPPRNLRFTERLEDF